MQGKILLVDDEKDLLEWLSVVLRKEGYIVKSTTSAEEALLWFKQESFDMVISDIRMPVLSGVELLRQVKKHNPEVIVLMITAYASVETAVKALRFGAYDYLTKPFKLDDIKLIIKKAFSQKRIFSDDKSLEKKLKERYRFSNIIGKSKAMQQVFDIVDKVARTNTTVLINGESGTGKELIAKAIHYNSLRANKPFVSIDCGALPDELLESELFGHVKGSFTGAISSKQGLFEVADGGTLFLDEIGETSQATQAKLLRALQEREIRAVGATRPVKVDVRVVAATNRNLDEEVRHENFRKDLFYRISVISMHLPKLYERTEDIPLLVSHFLKKYQLPGKPLKKVSQECMDVFSRYRWPGNVRELENAIESAIALAESDTITPTDIPQRMLQPPEDVEEQITSESLKGKVEQFEKELIARTMSETGGNKNLVAKILKMTRRNLDYKIKRYGL
ncbi:MAG: sigma-54 dependent transcriptional regulator [Candidatus Omnitrophica bacterium]|nr:sigma-54 dependent transcriptional regulator [Candidatus Omnitrophota bacterium]MBU4478392.1 sigma-54 dependent transcriptional regulator [Candidatus Omnitrophota bacterium]